jgi:addiction module RelE/StbE family toxin
MPYKEEYHPKVKSDLKKLDRGIIKEIFAMHIDKILQAPYKGGRLFGDLEGIFSYHFKKNKVDYRIAYAVEENKSIVYIVKIGKRENFYEIIKRRLL